MAFPVERKQETSTEHVLETPVALSPVPETAEFLREKEPALIWVLRDECPYLLNLSLCKDPAPVANVLVHHIYVS